MIAMQEKKETISMQQTPLIVFVWRRLFGLVGGFSVVRQAVWLACWPLRKVGCSNIVITVLRGTRILVKMTPFLPAIRDMRNPGFVSNSGLPDSC